MNAENYIVIITCTAVNQRPQSAYPWLSSYGQSVTFKYLCKLFMATENMYTFIFYL